MIYDFFLSQTAASVAARALKCSVRNVTQWYNKFRNVGSALEQRASHQKSPSRMAPPKLCFVSGCDSKANAGSNFCERHTYKAPQNVARLTAARA